MATQPQSPREKQERRARALDQLLRSERRSLLRQARFHSRRDEDAEDALNDACVQFLRFYDGPAGEDALRWMLLVVKRAAWAVGRRASDREARVRAGSAELALTFSYEQMGPEELVERGEDTERVIGLIEGLKPDERTALILLGLGCSYQEIGELRNWSRTKVHRSIKHGRARIRKLLAGGAN
ncbi:MAG TPA: sigma-70 family RNA polymerase sigma factor [Solirubrobacterales bacterium]